MIQPNLRVTVLFENGRWYLIAQKHIKTETEIQGKVKCVAIDQGVSTHPATTYPVDLQEAIKGLIGGR